MTARLFVAVWPPADVLARLQRLPRHEHQGLRWTTEDQWHVTLRFLGRAEPTAVARALDRLDAALTVAVLDGRPRRLFRGVFGMRVDGLDDLAGAVGRVLHGLGTAADEREFHGHLTLARWRNGPAPRMDDDVSASWTVTEVALVESITSASGARYRTVREVPLR